MKIYYMESKFGYLDALARKDPGRIDPRYRGGAFGCPGDYFTGAKAEDCRQIDQAQCGRCWKELYQGEEWIEDDRE